MHGAGIVRMTSERRYQTYAQRGSVDSAVLAESDSSVMMCTASVAMPIADVRQGVQEDLSERNVRSRSAGTECAVNM